MYLKIVLQKSINFSRLLSYFYLLGIAERRIVCYYTNWSVYRPGTAKFSPQNINPYLCTHLIYAFGGFTKENALKPFDKYQDIEKGSTKMYNIYYENTLAGMIFFAINYLQCFKMLNSINIKLLVNLTYDITYSSCSLGLCFKIYK